MKTPERQAKVNFVFCAQRLSDEGTMWQKGNSGDRSVVRGNFSSEQRVEVGTWLTLREARRHFAAGRPSKLGTAC
jgi:hypothetical protein